MALVLLDYYEMIGVGVGLAIEPLCKAAWIRAVQKGYILRYCRWDYHCMYNSVVNRLFCNETHGGCRVLLGEHDHVYQSSRLDGPPTSLSLFGCIWLSQSKPLTSKSRLTLIVINMQVFLPNRAPKKYNYMEKPHSKLR